MRTFLILGLAAAALPAFLEAAEVSGTVRAADQFIPGATLTARQGDTKITAYTDENGRYRLNLPPGDWDIQVQILGFTPVQTRVTVGDQPANKDWTLEMPRPGEKGGVAAGASTSSVALPNSVTAQGNGRGGRGGRGGGFGGRGGGQAGAQGGIPGQGQGRGAGRGQQNPAAPTATTAQNGPAPNPSAPASPTAPNTPARPAFQNATVTTTGDQQTLDDAGAGLANLTVTADDAESVLSVVGSTSGGLGASFDQEAQRQRQQAQANNGAAAGITDASGLGLPPSMQVAGGDSLGIGGFGTQAADGGFGGAGGGAAGAGGLITGGQGAFGAGAGGPGFGGGGGGGRGGGRGGGGGGRGGRGGQRANFNNFGNRRPVQSQYSGSISVTAADSFLNAEPFSLNGQPAQKPSTTRANYTAQLGGPMVIPKILNWQRASFSLSYSGSHANNGQNTVGEVPTADERAGNFAGISNVLYDPTHPGHSFLEENGANAIPSTRLDAASVRLLNLNLFPQPLYEGITQNYRLIASPVSLANNIGGRLNAPLSNKDRLNYNAQYQATSSTNEQLFGFTDPTNGSGVSTSVGWSHSFAPRVNNSATFSISRSINKTVPYFAYGANIEANAGIAVPALNPIDYGPPTLSFSNFSSLSDATSSVSRNQTTGITDSFTYIFRRKHNFTFGGSYQRYQQNSLSGRSDRGRFSFNGLETSLVGPDGRAEPGTGFDFADFLLGLPQTTSLQTGTNDYFRSWSSNWFVQDDYRVSRGLTINVGLRYEYWAPYTELYGKISNIDLAPLYTAVGPVPLTPGLASQYEGSLPSSLVRSRPNNYSPRFGFAWRPTAKHSLVVRGGYSIFYSGSSYSSIVNSMAAQPPSATSVSLNQTTTPSLFLENGFTVPPSVTITNSYAVDPNYKIAYAQQWVLALQQTLPQGLLAEFEYLATKGTNLGVVVAPNQAIGVGPGGQQILRIADANGFTYQTSGANSFFNAGQIRLTRRFQQGMSFVALYTYSKSIDDASSFNGTGGTSVLYPFDWRLDRGLSSNDQRNKFSLTYQLSSPVGVRGMLRNGGWKEVALAGWTLQGTFTAADSPPLTALLGGAGSNVLGTGNQVQSRAEATGLPVTGGSNPYFNTAAFTTPPPGQFGNAGIDTIPGPFVTTLNATLNRTFQLGEGRKRLQLRLSATNALNHVEITGFGTTVGSSTYGLPTAASATRNVTLFLRFNF